MRVQPCPAFGSRPPGPPLPPPPPPHFPEEESTGKSTRPEPLPMPRWHFRMTDDERAQRSAAKARRDEIKAWDKKRWQLIESIGHATGSIHLHRMGDPYRRMQLENQLARMDGKPLPHPELTIIRSREELGAYSDLALDRFRKEPKYRPGSDEAYLDELRQRDR